MKIRFTQHGSPGSNVGEITLGVADVAITEVHNGIRLVTSEGNQFPISMRDAGLEINVPGTGWVMLRPGDLVAAIVDVVTEAMKESALAADPDAHSLNARIRAKVGAVLRGER